MDNGVSIKTIADDFEISVDDLRNLFIHSGKDVNFFNKYVKKGIVSKENLAVFKHVVEEKIEKQNDAENDDLPFKDADDVTSEQDNDDSSDSEKDDMDVTAEDDSNFVDPFTGEDDNGFRDVNDNDVPDGFKEEPEENVEPAENDNLTEDDETNNNEAENKETDVAKENEAAKETNNSESEKTEKKPRKKRKVTEECEINSDVRNVPTFTLRTFLLQNSNIKMEKLCVMGDKEVQNVVDEKFNVLKNGDKWLFIKKSYNIISMDVIEDTDNMD